MLGPAVCRYEHFLTGWYAKWAEELGFPVEVRPDRPMSYRKIWEFAAILEALDSRSVLEKGRHGLGFAVGREPLPSIMAARGVRVLATDLMASTVDAGWIDSGQHAASREAVFVPHIVDRQVFEELVSFLPADMNDLSTLKGQYDFLWSSCAFEHLGSLEAGLDFVEKSMQLLKPGGYAVHTTEYNVSSNHDTIMSGTDCIYRRRDLDALDRRLRRIGCGLEAIDFDAGVHLFDLDYDRPPYWEKGRVHIKLESNGYICTSLLVIARKGSS